MYCVCKHKQIYAIWDRTLDADCLCVYGKDPTVVFILTNRVRQTRQPTSF